MSTARMLRLSAGLAAAAAVTMAYVRTIRPWHLTWGATEDEVMRPLPGDDVVPEPGGLNTTRAVTIDAPPDAIWPWLAQMGFGRAGWYSYDLLDNAGRPSANRIMPQYQELGQGDYIPVAAKEGVRVGGWQLVPPERGFRVAAVEPGRWLVLTSSGMLDWRHPDPITSWCFYLEPVDGHRTRLIERIRSARPDRVAGVLSTPILEVADFIMMRKQMLVIKQRAERAALE